MVSRPDSSEKMMGAPIDDAFSTQPQVLVVDDEEQICHILSEYLAMHGFRVQTASNGVEALDLLDRHAFDVLMTDMKMPSMGGLELIEAVKRRSLDVVMVLMTGYGTVESAIRAMKHGVYDYITKPFKVEEIPPLLQRGLDKHRLHHENIQLREMLNLYRLTEMLSSGSAIENTLRHISDVLCREFRADGLAIYSREDEYSPNFILLRGSGLPEQKLVQWTPPIDWLTEQFTLDTPVCLSGRALQQRFQGDLPSELVSFLSVPMKVRGSLFGFLNLYSFTPTRIFKEGQRKALFMFAAHAAATIENVRMYQNLKRAFAQTIEGFARALEAKDKYTAGHSDRVASYALLIAKGLNLPEEELERVHHAALLHDIGKLGIRSEDLNKAQKLTQAEYVMFQSHPSLGASILEPLDFLNDLIPAVAYHHEQWDGSGYPEGLSGESIPLVARIISVADTYDAMTSNRAYRKALPHEYAIEELQRCAHSQFDPALVDIFCREIIEYRNARRAKDLPIPV